MSDENEMLEIFDLIMEGEQKLDEQNVVFLFFMVFAIGIVIGGALTDTIKGGDVSELGGAICDQEYDLDFDGYVNGELKCKNKEELVPYDGIKIKIGDV